MQTYTYTTLTDDVQRNISNGAYKREELEEIYGGLKEKAVKGKSKMKKVLIILIVVYLLMIVPSLKSVFDMGDSSIAAFIVSLLVPLPFFAIGYALARWHSFGMFCHQWNKAIKKGYPMYAKNYTLQ